MDIYLVGGAVRDQLLDLPVKDRDWVVVGATPQQMIDQGYRQVGADFPVFLRPQTHEEYALARTERKQGHGYHGFVVHSSPEVTLEADLERRDLTINAMAQDRDGHIVDPFNGQRDLSARTLRHVSPAFAEDPLRILRTARFAARFAPLGFTVTAETRALMQSMVSEGEADHLVPERVWQETQRALQEKVPRVYFEILQSCGALSRLMAPLARILETRGQNTHFPLEALEAACKTNDATAVRFAALVGATGSPEAVKKLHRTLRIPKDCDQLATLALSLAPKMLPLPESPQALQFLFDEADAWRRPERFSQLMTAVEAIAQASGTQLMRTGLESALESAREVDPKALMAEGYSGPALGKAIHEARRSRIAAALIKDRR
jgi:tRNA nucleotidyltransferase (CCA-adding enzyme)